MQAGRKIQYIDPQTLQPYSALSRTNAPNLNNLWLSFSGREAPMKQSGLRREISDDVRRLSHENTWTLMGSLGSTTWFNRFNHMEILGSLKSFRSTISAVNPF